MGLYVVKWSSYNESLVRRGEVILDFDVIDSWDSELKRMNNGKKGAQYMIIQIHLYNCLVT
jgi:hypothetical protein